MSNIMFPSFFVLGFSINSFSSVHPMQRPPIRPSMKIDADIWSYTELSQSIDHNSLSKVIVNPNSITALDKSGNLHKTALYPMQIESTVAKMISHNVDVSFAMANTAIVEIFQLLPYFVLGFLFYKYILPAFSGSIGQAQSLMKMGDKLTPVEQVNVTFADVAGCDESKLELEEVVEFLKDSERFTKVGAKIPRGVLLEGPPGTGKTLLARAVAGESQVPFISISGSDFVEMYVGLGASRVRQLFSAARTNSPCIVFIDEIDAVGKKRSGSGGGMGGGGGNDEREQTLNQILSEMDGFSKASDVIVIAATNRADMLDDALLRPGRFDRKVPVPLPDLYGRRKLFEIHSTDKPIKNVDFDALAKQTIGFSGADISNVMNEASIGIARENKTNIKTIDIEGAIEKITIGIQKTRKGVNSAKSMELVAYHEAGHALVGHMCSGFDTVNKISILPRLGGLGGFTQFLPSEERLLSNLYTREYLESQLCTCMGGRAAEELIYGKDKITIGASSDLKVARTVAMQMVSLWGFGDDLASFGDGSETSWTKYDQEDQARDLVNDAYRKALCILQENLHLLETLKNALLEKEVLNAEDITKVLNPKA